MVFGRASVILGLVLFAAAWSMPAPAAIVTGNFVGRTFSGFDLGSDPGGFFGLGVDLDDQDITGTFSYDTDRVPPASSNGPNFATYSDPTFSTDFLHFTVTVNGRSYTFGSFAGPPGIQSIEVIDNTDQLQFDYRRFGLAPGVDETFSLRLISAQNFLTGTGVPMSFQFVPAGIGLEPVGFFAFDLPNGDFAEARFTILGASAHVLPEPATLGVLTVGLLGLAATRRRSRSCRR